MAAGIFDCKGKKIERGCKVRTAGGDVIRVTGAAISTRFYNAEECTVVSSKTPVKRSSKARVGESDCVVWGS